MSLFLWNLLLALIYASVSNSFTPVALAFGFTLGYLVLFISTPGARRHKYFNGLLGLFNFLIFYFVEFLKAALKVGLEVLTPKSHMRPGIIAIPLDAKTDAEISLLANLITLTPGGISLEISKDRSTLFIYEMYLDPKKDPVREVKEGLEKRVLEVLRP